MTQSADSGTDRTGPADPVPAGADARRAWRALDPQTRVAAMAAAEKGGAHPDAAVARIAAGYGAAAVADGRKWGLLAAGAVAAGLLALVLVDRLAPDAHTAWRITALINVAIILGGGGLALVKNRNRYRMAQLHSANMLAIERERATTAVGKANPREAGDAEIRVKRTQALFLIILAVALTTGTIGRVATKSGPLGPLDYLLPGFFLLMTAVLVGSNLRMLINPVFARLTPTGWELPPWRVSGTWNQVKGIRVRADGPEARLIAVDLRGVKVDSFRAPFDQRLHLRRALDGQGTPFVVQAHRKLNMPAPEMVDLLRRYTNAPVTWG